MAEGPSTDRWKAVGAAEEAEEQEVAGFSSASFSAEG